jgi:integrase
MVIGRLSKTKHSGVYRRNDGRLVVRVTARLPGKKWVQTTELQGEDSTLERARRRAEVLRQRVQDQAETIRSDQAAPPQAKAVAPISGETLGEYCKRWYGTRSQRLKPGSKKRYEEVIWARIIPRIGNIRISEVSRSTVEEWVTWVERLKQPNGSVRYAQGTLTGWWRVFVQILRDAAADYDLPDPTRRVRPPESTRSGVRETRVLTDEELERFLGSVRQYAPDHYAAILTMSMTGLRVGEVYALQWDSVDFTREELTIQRTVSGCKLSETTKTHAPRVVPMHSSLVEAMKEHRKAMLSNPTSGLQGNWVFPNSKGEMRLPQSVRKAFELAREAAHIDQVVSPQVLRRTLNTMMIRDGVDRIVLRAIMGHCSEAMTARYAGVNSNDKRNAIVKLFPEKGEKG